MPKEKNTKKNLYQILIIICTLAIVVYGYSLYVSLKLHNNFKILLNGVLTAAWLFCAVIWWLQLKKIRQQENENNSPQ